MSGAPRARSMNAADLESRPVLGPTGNKTGPLGIHEPALKLLREIYRPPGEANIPAKKGNLCITFTTALSSKLPLINVPSVLHQHERLLQSNLSLNTSCSSDGSTDSFQSRASTGRLICSISGGSRRNPQISKQRSVVSDSGLDFVLDSPPPIGTQIKKCVWVALNTGNCLSFLSSLVLCLNSHGLLF